MVRAHRHGWRAVWLRRGCSVAIQCCQIHARLGGRHLCVHPAAIDLLRLGVEQLVLLGEFQQRCGVEAALGATPDTRRFQERLEAPPQQCTPGRIPLLLHLCGHLRVDLQLHARLGFPPSSCSRPNPSHCTTPCHQLSPLVAGRRRRVIRRWRGVRGVGAQAQPHFPRPRVEWLRRWRRRCLGLGLGLGGTAMAVCTPFSLPSTPLRPRLTAALLCLHNTTARWSCWLVLQLAWRLNPRQLRRYPRLCRLIRCVIEQSGCMQLPQVAQRSARGCEVHRTRCRGAPR